MSGRENLINKMDNKEQKVKISKIHNWISEEKKVFLNIQFYSAINHDLIASKMVRAFNNGDYLEIGVTLIVKYNKEDSHLRIIIKKTDGLLMENPELKSKQIIAETEIDLNDLSESKIKYYPTGWRNQALEVELAEGFRERIKFLQPQTKRKGVCEREQNFIKERKKFLSKVNENEILLRRSFSQKIFSLINSPTSSKALSFVDNQPSQITKNQGSNLFDLQSKVSQKGASIHTFNQQYYKKTSPLEMFPSGQKTNKHIPPQIRTPEWKKIIQRS